MAKISDQEKPSKQPDLFEMPRAGETVRRARPRRHRLAQKRVRAASLRGSGLRIAGYTAKHIEVLEGLEPVRRRPGMYIGGTDEKALHHLFAEVIDNAMDEALAGHADWIEVEMAAERLRQRDRQWPRHSGRSASEVQKQVRARSHHVHAARGRQIRLRRSTRRPGGLHGVGVSVANALSERMEVEVARGSKLYRDGVRARQAERQAGEMPAARRTGAAPRCASSPIPKSSGRRLHSSPSACSRWRARRPISMAASKFAGTATRRCSKASRTCPRRPRSISPMDLKDYLAVQSDRRDAGASRHLHRLGRQDRPPRCGRMGRGLDCRH